MCSSWKSMVGASVRCSLRLKTDAFATQLLHFGTLFTLCSLLCFFFCLTYNKNCSNQSSSLTVQESLSGLLCEEKNCGDCVTRCFFPLFFSFSWIYQKFSEWCELFCFFFVSLAIVFRVGEKKRSFFGLPNQRKSHHLLSWGVFVRFENSQVSSGSKCGKNQKKVFRIENLPENGQTVMKMNQVKIELDEATFLLWE